jgi:hypothetical protein
MSNISNAQISGKITTPFKFIEEQKPSLVEETLSVVGTSNMGPAFVPQHVMSFEKSEFTLNTWENIFGDFDKQKDQIGPITAKTWLENNGTQLTYTRVLGIGDGNGLLNESYTDAGFVVGDSPLSGSIIDGVKSDNAYSVQGGDKGKTHFFGSYYKNLDIDEYVSPYNDYIKQITGDESLEKIGIVTDVVFASSGSIFHLQDNELDYLLQEEIRQELVSTASDQSISFGAKSTSVDYPKIYVQGLLDKRNLILDFYDKTNVHLKTNFYENNFNDNPDYYLNAGNLRYASFRNTHPLENTKLDNNITHFVATGKNLWNNDVDVDNNTVINYENFESIFTKAKTPWIISQAIYKPDNFRQNLKDNCKKLFRFHAYTDGEKGNKYRFRIKPRRIGNINKTDLKEKWSLFDVIVYKYNYKKNKFYQILNFESLNLDPRSENYICKKIGSEKEYYDLSIKKVCHEGIYKKTNNHVYVEVHPDVEYMTNETDLIPGGFLPYPHINIENRYLNLTEDNRVIHNPIHYVGNMMISEVENNTINYDFDNTHWGVDFSKHKIVYIKDIPLTGDTVSSRSFAFNKIVKEKDTENHFYYGYTKYFQDFKQQKFWLTSLDDNENDEFNDLFHLEKIVYLPNEETIKEKWQYAFYRRDATDIATSSIPDVYEYIDLKNELTSNSEADAQPSVYLSFDLFTYGGFDGINILDENKRKLNNASCLREYEQEIVGKTTGQTTNAYKIAKDIALDVDNFRCDMFTIPGINTPEIVRNVIDASRESTKFIYLFDIIDYDDNNNIIKNNYYFNNLGNNIKDVLDENNQIKNRIINGTNNSIDNHIINHYDSIYSVSTSNLSEIVVDDVRLVAPSSLIFINSLAQSSRLSEPVDSITYTNNTFSVVNPINSKFIYNNNEFDSLIKKSKSKPSSVNPIGVISAGKQIKPLSANTLCVNRKNVFSLVHNVRVYLDIKRRLKDLLTVQPLVNNETVLFNPISETNIFSNIKPQVEIEILNFLEGYKNRGEIKDYFVNLNIANLDKTKREKLENTLSGDVAISFFGDNINQDFFKKIEINSLINDINDFTQENNINIINIDS